MGLENHREDTVVVTQEQNMEQEVEKKELLTILETSEDDNFPGSIIFKTETPEGRVVGYALRKNESGDMEGNKINYTEDGSVGTVYKLHEADFQMLGEQGVVEKFELLKEFEIGTEDEAESGNENIEAKRALFEIYNLGDSINPFSGSFPESGVLDAVSEKMSALSDEEQEQLATDFFNETIGADITNNKNAYSVYGCLKGTVFAQKFKQLESGRLQAAGFGEFNL